MPYSYSQAISFLNSLLNFEFHSSSLNLPSPSSSPRGRGQRKMIRSWNLKRMRELLEIFNHPERKVFTVVVGGTKGKGSTAYFLSEILRESGLRVGLYHSPHLESPRERIWIQGRPVSGNDFAEGISKIRNKLTVIARRRRVPTKQSLAPGIASDASRPRNDTPYCFTYFEILTLLAALLFKEKKVDVAIYEVGMGGRLDATHVFPAKLVILTPIHYDHEAYLGNTLTEIAREKAALLVQKKDAVVAPQEKEVGRVIHEMARQRNCTLWPPLSLNGERVQLLGDFQKLNASVAKRAATVLRDRYDFPITEEALANGIASNRWPGRMELFKGRPSILLDGAHNPKSIEALCRNVKQLFPKKRKILVFGTSRDKRFDRMLPFLSKAFDLCILTQAQTPRAQEISTLLNEARNFFSVVIPKENAGEALALARTLARPEDLIVATGSFYLIGELRSQCRN